jgi:hypothetical protein
LLPHLGVGNDEIDVALQGFPYIPACPEVHFRGSAGRAVGFQPWKLGWLSLGRIRLNCLRRYLLRACFRRPCFLFQ